jgi:hypothetical protein
MSLSVYAHARRASSQALCHIILLCRALTLLPMDQADTPATSQHHEVEARSRCCTPPPSARIQPGNIHRFYPTHSELPHEAAASGGGDHRQAHHEDVFIKEASKDEVHSWAPCAPGSFMLRSGPNYRHTGKKAPSLFALYEARARRRGFARTRRPTVPAHAELVTAPQVYAMDLFHSERKLPHIGRVVSLPNDPDAALLDPALPPHLIVNWLFPNYPPSGLLGPRRTDGPGFNLVLYCRLSDRARAMLRDGTHASLPSIDLLRRFMHPDAAGAQLRGRRLKCIFGLADREQSGVFGMMLKPLICRWNFKPFVSKTASWCYVGRVRAPPCMPIPPRPRSASLRHTRCCVLQISHSTSHSDTAGLL